MKHKRTSLIITLSTFILAAVISGYGGMAVASDVREQVEKITNKYQSEWDAIKREGESLKDDAPEGSEIAVGVDLDCNMKRNEVKLDIPEVTMNTRNMSLHVPQVTMKTNRIVWDEPHTYTGTTVCGYYPEFRDLRVTMREILCDLPQVRMERKEAKIDIPEFRWDRTDFKIDIPEFKMVTQRWVFDLPECKVKDVSVEAKKIKEKSKDLQNRSTHLAESQKREINQVVITNLTKKRNEADAAFRSGIAKVSEAIKVVKSYGMDPAHVKQQDGSFVNLVAKMQELESKRKAEMSKLDSRIKALAT